MTNFLIAALMVFLMGVVVFSLAFSIAIQLRLLRVQPEIEELVDRLFSNFFISNAAKKNYPRVLIDVAGQLVTGQLKRHGFTLAAVGTVVAATAAITVVLPMEQGARTTCRVQNGEECYEISEYSKPVILKPVIWNEKGLA